MNETVVKNRVNRALDVMPPELVRQISAAALGRVGGISDVREIRIKRGGACFAVFSSGSVRLGAQIGDSQFDAIVRRITDGSLYAYRDSIARGYIPMPSGIRVGVCGSARYDGGELTVEKISSLVFRIPTDKCDVSEQLYGAYLKSHGGILIYSPPGGGKTTALRSLAHTVSQRASRHIVVVDERSEFDTEDFSGLSVDILSGYSRREGIELALRTLTAEVIMVDELMGDECREIEYSFLSGIPIIATAHAGSLGELLMKRELAELISKGVFSTFIGIKRSMGKYSLDVAEDLDGCLNI